MTFEQAVGRVQAIMENASAEKIGNVAVQIQFTNSDCKGIMYISTKTGELDVQGYDYYDCDAAVELVYGDLSKVLTGKLSAANAIARGDIVVSGNPDAFLALAGCAKKAPAKKPAAKKAPAKKAPVKKAEPKKAETKKAEPKKAEPAPKKSAEKKPAAKKTAAKTAATKKTVK